jgi:crotonobetainyl-CoA:carnitine CoA-transferase CaiB-like acyl-CoA transferase
MGKPLGGLRVVELGTYVAAPALGSMLGMLGAEVVKVEPPEGDPTRKLTPWSWVNYNWNKKSVVLDLKSQRGGRAMRELLKRSDVFVESLSPRAVDELGLGYAKVKRLNRKLVYCSIKGFASDSSSAQRVGFDTIAQAEGGLMFVARGEDGRPARVGNPCVDLTAATFGAMAVLSSLLVRPRAGAHIEIPLLDVVVFWNGYWMPYIDLYQSEPTNLSSTHPGFSPYGVFDTRDGYVFIGVLADPQWRRLTAGLKIASPPEFASMANRIESRAKVNSLVQDSVGRLTSEEVLSLLGLDVPCARVSSLTDVHGDPELRRRGVLGKVRSEGREFTIALPPMGRKKEGGRPARTPRLGGDTQRVLRNRTEP